MKPEDMNKADLFTSIFLFLLGLIVFIISVRMPTFKELGANPYSCLLYTSPSPRDRTRARMPSSA